MSTRPTVATDRHRTASIAAVWLATAGFCLALLAAPALATVSYPNEKEISAAGQDAGLPQVAIDGFDRATISWIRSDGSNDRVQSVRVGADGTPEAVKNLSASGEDAQSQRIAIDSSGRPTVIWARSDGSHNRIQSVRIGSNGTPEAVKTLSAAGQNAYSPEIAIDSADRATIVWARFDGSNRRIQSVRIGADGTPEAVKTLSEAGEKADDAAVAIDNSGRPTVTWERSNGSHNLIQSVRIGTDGTPEAVKTLSEAGRNAFFPEMVIDNAGRATIVWRRYDGSDIRIQSVRIGTDGTPEAVRNLSEAGESGDRVRIAIDVSDRPTVIWQRYDGLNFRIQSVRLGADGVPGTIQTVSEPDRDASRNQLAVDGSGRVTIAWDHNDFPKSVQPSAWPPTALPVRSRPSRMTASLHSWQSTARIVRRSHGRILAAPTTASRPPGTRSSTRGRRSFRARRGPAMNPARVSVSLRRRPTPPLNAAWISSRSAPASQRSSTSISQTALTSSPYGLSTSRAIST